MIETLFQKAWQFLSSSFPDIDTNGMMNKAMEVGKSQASTGAVMSVLENVARDRGYIGALQGNSVWESLKKKKPDEVISYTHTTIQEMGLMPMITSLITKK